MFINGYDIVKRMKKGTSIDGIHRYESMVDLLASASDIWVVEAEFNGDSLIGIKKSYTGEEVMWHLFKNRNELTSRISSSDGEKKIRFQIIEAMYFGDKQKYYSVHRDPRLRQIVANNGCFLERLAKDKSRRVRAEALRNKYYEGGILLGLKRLFLPGMKLCIPNVVAESKEKECMITNYTRAMAFGIGV